LFLHSVGINSGQESRNTVKWLIECAPNRGKNQSESFFLALITPVVPAPWKNEKKKKGGVLRLAFPIFFVSFFLMTQPSNRRYYTGARLTNDVFLCSSRAVMSRSAQSMRNRDGAAVLARDRACCSLFLAAFAIARADDV
jgi:hypothetical protein